MFPTNREAVSTSIVLGDHLDRQIATEATGVLIQPIGLAQTRAIIILINKLEPQMKTQIFRMFLEIESPAIMVLDTTTAVIMTPGKKELFLMSFHER